MPPIVWEHRPERLRAPAMVCAFGGWNDAAEAATSAAAFIGAAAGAKRFAHLDPEGFYDFQATRPQISLVEGEAREITWPTVEISSARVRRAPRDLVIVSGPEPSMHWRTFCESVVDLAEALDVQMVISLGALLADVAHTRPVPMVGITSDETLAERTNVTPPSYEGPTGITGVLHGAFEEAGVPAVSIWASVPHYVAAAPNPKASLALVRKVESIAGVSVDASDLESAAADYERRVSGAVAGDEEVRSFVERLEEAADAEAELESEEDVPSADALARDFQRFLNQRGDES